MTDEDDVARIRARKAAWLQALAKTARDDLSWLLGDRRGRRFIMRLIEDSGVHASSFSSDSNRMAFSEGRREFGRSVLQEIVSEFPDLYSVLLKEAKDDRDSNPAS